MKDLRDWKLQYVGMYVGTYTSFYSCDIRKQEVVLSTPQEEVCWDVCPPEHDMCQDEP